MLTEFLKSHINDVIWLVVADTMVKGKLVSIHLGIDNEIKFVELSDVLVQGCSAPSLVVPGQSILMWGPRAKEDL